MLPWSWIGSHNRKAGDYPPLCHGRFVCFPVHPLQSVHHSSDGMLLSLLALCGPFPCPPDHKQAPLVVPVLWRCPSQGQEVNSFLWISCLLLSDAFQAEACLNSAPILLNICTPSGLDLTRYFTQARSSPFIKGINQDAGQTQICGKPLQFWE